MEKLFHALRSKTVLVALAQGVAGVLIALFTNLDLVGYVAIVKSVLDIYIRSITTQPLSEK